MSCPDCFKGAVHDHAGEPHGTMAKLYNHECYISNPPRTSQSKSTIVFFCDAFGLNLVNSKLLCDRYAAGTGMRVIAPAIIPGGPAPVVGLTLTEDLLGKTVQWWDIWGQLLRIVTFIRLCIIFLPFVILKGPAKALRPSLKFARQVRADLPAGGKLGVAGFCWGGYLSTNLCKEPAVEGGKERLVDAQFCGHPSGLSPPGMVVDAVRAFRTPYSMAVGDRDFVYNEQQVRQTRTALRDEVGKPEENDYEIGLYKGCRHGFAVRAFPGDEAEMAAMQEAEKQAVSWFKKFLREERERGGPK